jgi:arylsulfatase A-like enzyme
MLVVLYVLDALRADHLSCYGYTRETSPNIDRLAAEGVLFRNCFTPATWTRPAAASILSGAYPSVHATQTRIDAFSASIPRLPEFLQDAEFDTAAFSAMANISIAGGFGEGFGHFVELFRDESLRARRHTSTAAEEGLGHLDAHTRIVLPRSEDIHMHFCRWLRRAQGGNRFAFIWSIDTHVPYDPPPGFHRFVDQDYDGDVDGSRQSVRKASERDARRLIDLYDSEILYNDYQIGQLLKELRSLGLYDDSLLIVTADHGEAFCEHGLFSHGNVPYEELINVPLIIKFPGGDFAGSESGALVELIDLCPTILDWVGLGEFARRVGSIQGKSLLPLLRGEQTELREYVFSETQALDFQNAHLSVRSERWKYIETRPPPRSFRTIRSLLAYVIKQGMLGKILSNSLWFLGRHAPRQRSILLDLVEDPPEQRNLLHVQSEEADRLKSELVMWQKRNQAIAESINLRTYSYEEDEAIRRHLEELGYL